MNRLKQRLFNLCILIIFLMTIALVGCSSHFDDKTFNAQGTITAFKMDADCAQVTIKATDGLAKIEYQQNGVFAFSVVEENGVLYMDSVRDVHFFGGKIPSVVVYMPTACVLDVNIENGDVVVEQNAFVSFKVETDNGKVTVDGATVAGDLYLGVDNGEITLQNSTVADGFLEVEIDNGDISITNVTASGNVDVASDNGALLVDTLHAQEVVLSADNADFSLKNVTCTDLLIELDNGDVVGQKIDVSNHCRVELSVGGIYLQLKGKQEDYKITVDTELGDINISDNTNASAKRSFVAITEIGDINVTFYQ